MLIYVNLCTVTHTCMTANHRRWREASMDQTNENSILENNMIIPASCSQRTGFFMSCIILFPRSLEISHYNLVDYETFHFKANHKYRGMFETQKSGNKTSSGEIVLNIRTHTSPKVWQNQASGGVSMLCWHAAPVAIVLWKPRKKGKKSNSVIRSRSVTGSKVGVMSDQLRVSLYMVIL